MKKSIIGQLCGMHILVYILVLIGAFSWGLVALGWYMDTNLNVVNILLGGYPMVEYGIYLVVGLSAVVMLFQGSCDYCGDEV